MSKKTYKNELEDDDIQDILPIDEGRPFGGLIPQFQDNYAPINIEEVREDLEKKSRNVIERVVKVYYKFSSDDDNDEIHQYLEQAQELEKMNLQNLLLQVKASEHMLYSLLGRLNATGSVDNSLYKLINDVQKDSIALTMQVSNYIRSLPTYFKQLRFELETNIEMVTVEQTQEMIEQKTDETGDDFIKRPQKGMRQLLRELEAAEQEMSSSNETIEENIKLPEKNYEPEPIIDGITEEDLKRQLLQDNEE